MKKNVRLTDSGRTIVLDVKRFSQHAWWRKKNPRVAAFAAAAAMLAVILWGIFVRAQVSQFYPASCLGNWLRVENALGKPDLAPSAGSADFNDANSAIFHGKDAQIFCGNFSGDIPQGKIFKTATLSLLWTFRDTSAPLPPTEQSAAPAPTPSGIQAAPSASAPTETPESGTPPPSESPQPSPLNENTENLPTELPTKTPIASPVASPEESPAESPAASMETPTASPGESPTALPETSRKTPENLWQFVKNIAFGKTADAAEEPSPLDAGITPQATPDALQAQSSAPEPSVEAQKILPLSPDVAEGATAQTSPTLAIPFGLDQKTLDGPETSLQSPGTFLEVSVSLDGASWQVLGEFGASNWRSAVLNLPIHSWEEVSRLQVRIRGAATAEGTPSVYLDGMRVSAEYEDTLPSPSPEQITAAGKGAGSCQVSPFSKTMQPRTDASFQILLHPSRKDQTLDPLVRVGSLPKGVTSFIKPLGDPSGAFVLSLYASADAQVGSFSLVVRYFEDRADPEEQAVACPYNLTIEETP